MDPDQAVFDIQTMEEGLSQSLAGQRFLMRLFGTFGGLAVVLAAVGIYGIVSYLVTERTREFGVRIALGAQREDVVKLVVSGVLKTTAVGVLIGIAGSLALTRLIAQFLYGVQIYRSLDLFIGLAAVHRCCSGSQLHSRAPCNKGRSGSGAAV